MKQLRVQTRHLKLEGFSVWTMNGKTMSAYVRFTSNQIQKTREVLPEVFADFDRHGDIVGMEFLRPGEFDVDCAKQVSEKYNLEFPRTLAAFLSEVRPTEELVTAK